MRWRASVVALAAMVAFGSGAWGQTPSTSDKDKMMEKDKMMDRSGAMPDKMDKGKMGADKMEKDKMIDQGTMSDKDKAMEKKP